MLCQNCGKKNYTIKITRLRNGQAEELKLCDECAALLSPYHQKLSKKSGLEKLDKQAVENLLKDLLAQKEAGVSASSGTTITTTATPTGISCDSCGLEFRRYKQTFMLGCPDCYENFGEHLLQDIERVHHASQHVGGRTRRQTRLLDVHARVRALRLELDESVESEDFDRAAKIRDELQELQRQAQAEELN